MSSDSDWTDIFFGYFTMFAIKSDGTLWSWGCKAKYYTLAIDANSDEKPRQVGTDSDWQSGNSCFGGFYQLLTKKDGSLWSMDASDHSYVKPDDQYRPVRYRKVAWDKSIEAYTSYGDTVGVVLTRDGELWTWGSVAGEHDVHDYWTKDWKRLSPKIRFEEKPWQILSVDATK